MWRFYFGAFLACCASFIFGLYYSKWILKEREKLIRALLAQLYALKADLASHVNVRTGRNPTLPVDLTAFEEDGM
jgi:hypothetical protein